MPIDPYEKNVLIQVPLACGNTDLRDRKISTTRSISPGTMADGRHVETSGDRGENYEPGVKDKIKGFFRKH